VTDFIERRNAEVQHSPLQTTQDRQRGSKKRGGPVIRGKEEREDRPNAVTPITLRLPTEMRLCQVTIIRYTRWPFLNRRYFQEPYPAASMVEVSALIDTRLFIEIEAVAVIE
jgi:hypothetical protein